MARKDGRNRVLYLIGSRDPGGAEKVLFQLALNFQLKGYDVTVGHLGNAWLSNELKRHDVRDIPFTFSKLYSSHKTEWLFVSNLMKFIKARAFDLIHAHLFGMILYSSIPGRILKIPVLGTVHDKYYFMEKGHRRLAYKVIQMLGCKLVTVSEDIRNNLSARWGIRRNDIATIYNGVDLRAFDITMDRNKKRKDMGLQEDDIAVISVGRLVRMKGHSSLIRTAKEIVRKNSKIKFIIAGDGPEREELERMALGESISGSVFFTGHRDDVPELLSASDIFVQTSYTEGLSCTILEALGAGCPVVATDAGGNKEIISDGKEGYIVPIADQTALQCKILALADSAELRAQFAERAKQKARDFSLKMMIDNYEQLYLNLLRRAE